MRRQQPRRRNPGGRDVISILRRARAVASLVERAGEVGRMVALAWEHGSPGEMRRLREEQEQIEDAAERVVADISHVLND